MLGSTLAQAAPNSFAEKDQAGHLLAYMTQGEDLPVPREQSIFGIPDTPILYSVLRDGDGPVRMRFESEGQPAHEISLPLGVHADDTISAWPMFIRIAEADAGESSSYLLGVMQRRQQGYSGGGANEHRVHLFRVDYPRNSDTRARPVLSLPLAADKLIRACFSENDEARRGNACHDSYKFEALLHLDTGQNSDWPVLLYHSQARVAPGVLAGLLASQRQLPDRALTAAEVEERTDPHCSLQRSIRYNSFSLRYEMETPAPDCSDFFVPN